MACPKERSDVPEHEDNHKKKDVINYISPKLSASTDLVISCI